MDKLEIIGGKKLQGSINISGSKNATLPILAATILSKKIIIKNTPFVRDIQTMINLLSSLGSKIKINLKKNIIKINNPNKLETFASYNHVKTMRAGVLVLGPLLAKFGKAKVSLPGGCAIGARPIDLHIEGLKKLGAKIKLLNGYIYATAKKKLKGTKINFNKISVGATENLLIAACTAQGRTILNNCACEPEIKDLVNFLNKMGSKIKWMSKRKIQIDGVNELKECTYKVMFDRLEAGTFVIAAAATNGKVRLNNVNWKVINCEISVLKKMGVKFTKHRNQLIVIGNKKIKKTNVSTKPYPGFPTDLQAQLMTLMCLAKGDSKITENIFENRFMQVPELKRMGARIKIKGKKAFIKGNQKLTGAELMATDLRASVSLVIAALVAKNKSIINRVYHLDRGYENIEKKLSSCGAQIKRIE